MHNAPTRPGRRRLHFKSWCSGNYADSQVEMQDWNQLERIEMLKQKPKQAAKMGCTNNERRGHSDCGQPSSMQWPSIVTKQALGPPFNRYHGIQEHTQHGIPLVAREPHYECGEQAHPDEHNLGKVGF